MKRISPCRQISATLFGILPLCLVLAAPPAVSAQSGHQEAVDAATHLLRMAMHSPSSNERDQLIIELRRLRDPDLEPLFRAMAKSPDETRRAHAMLALVELGVEKGIDLDRLAMVTSRGVQFEVMRQMADDEILNESMARAVMNYPRPKPKPEGQKQDPGIHDATRLMAGVWLMHGGKKVDTTKILEILDSEDFHVRHIAAALLAETGNAKALKIMNDLNASDNPERDSVRTDLLLTAAKYELTHLGPWALSIATDDETEQMLRFAALEVAIKLKAPGAATAWQKMYTGAERYAQRLRLALILMGSATYVQPSEFNELASDSSPVLSKIGQVGQAISAQKKNIATLAVDLIQDNYVPANVVLLNYAATDASKNDARAIMLGLMLTVNSAERDVQRLFNQAQSTSEAYFENYRDLAMEDLPKILKRESTDPLVAKALIYGLLETDDPGTDKIVEGLTPFDDRNTERVAILLLARADRELSQEKIDELRYLVRGGGKLKQRVRMQAAWAYLKVTNEHNKAVQEALKRP